MKNASPLTEELEILSALLQSENFAMEMASISAPMQNEPEPFPQLDNESLLRSFKEEKIAVSMAPFYALECGVQALMPAHPAYLFFDWLEQLLNNNLNADQVLLLNRFANATWKAGQPFRDLARIKRYNCTSAALLSPEEVAKDYHQLRAAAEKLYPMLLPLKNAGSLLQLQKLQELLGNLDFAADMAMHVDAAYYISQQQIPPPFLKPGEAEKYISKTIHAEKTATALSGFYALECGLSYFATRSQLQPSVVLASVINGSIPIADQRILDCFAHAIYMAGTVFKGLHNIAQPSFSSFYFLGADRIQFYRAHIKSAAYQVQKYL